MPGREWTSPHHEPRVHVRQVARDVILRHSQALAPLLEVRLMRVAVREQRRRRVIKFRRHGIRPRLCSPHIGLRAPQQRFGRESELCCR